MVAWSRLQPLTPKKLCIDTLLGTVGLTGLIAVGFSKSYWGYWFQRPDVLSETYSLESVEQVIPIEKSDTTSTQFRVDTHYSKDAAYAATDYSFLDERHWVTLVDAGVLPETFAFDQDLGLFEEFHQQLSATGLLVSPEPGYETLAEEMQGVITVGTTDEGKQLALVSLRGGQLSNDHYPYYEMVFNLEPRTGELTFVRGQRFFFDIAGIEGFEWPILWLVFMVLSWLILLPIFGLGVLLHDRKQAK